MHELHYQFLVDFASVFIKKSLFLLEKRKKSYFFMLIKSEFIELLRSFSHNSCVLGFITIEFDIF